MELDDVIAERDAWRQAEMEQAADAEAAKSRLARLRAALLAILDSDQSEEDLMVERDVLLAAIAYETNWNKFSSLTEYSTEDRVEKAKAHQGLLDAVREYRAHHLSVKEET